MQNLEKIEKIFGMIGSDSEGECLNAVALIKRNLKSQNKNWNDLARHLFAATPRSGGQNYSQEPGSGWGGAYRSHQGWRDYGEKEAQRRQQEREGEREKAEQRARHQREQDSQTYGSGRYQARDPYPGYAEHKKMCGALVAKILDKTSRMTQWETEFIKDIYNKKICMASSLSSKQESILQRIYEQYINR